MAETQAAQSRNFVILITHLIRYRGAGCPACAKLRLVGLLAQFAADWTVCGTIAPDSLIMAGIDLAALITHSPLSWRGLSSLRQTSFSGPFNAVCRRLDSLRHDCARFANYGRNRNFAVLITHLIRYRGAGIQPAPNFVSGPFSAVCRRLDSLRHDSTPKQSRAWDNNVLDG